MVNFVYDSNHIMYNVYDVEKLIKSNINSADNYNMSLYCLNCNKLVYFRERTAKRKAQICHFKNQRCFKPP